MPSASEKKRNKKGEEFMYDPEDTTYLNTPYRETGTGVGRYEMSSTGSNDTSVHGRGADWPIRNTGVGAAELEGRGHGEGPAGWRRGPHEKG